MPALIVADRQTAGRGRGEHRWWTGHGALAFSLLLDPRTLGGHGTVPPPFALAVGVSLAHVVRSHFAGGKQDRPDVGLHWPNDVYLNDRKLAGILTEAVTPRRVIVGVGVNTNNTLDDAPPELRAKAITLRDATGRTFDHAEFLLRWSDELRAAIALLYADPDALIREFQSLCVQVGRTTSLRVGEQVHVGRCLGVAPDGALLLETAAGVRAFHTGTSSAADAY
ncbi:MAG: biotin--[acetyl-CoA-carboxylase] ligase [Pirellulales bacterium]